MKKYPIFLITLFFILFISFYCFAATPVHVQYAKSSISHKEMIERPEDYGFSEKVENGVRIIEVKASKISSILLQVLR